MPRPHVEISIPTKEKMTTIETLLDIERRAPRALVQELRVMKLQVLQLRASQHLDEKAYSDGLLLKLDALEAAQQVETVTLGSPQSYLMPSLQIDPVLETTLPASQAA